jgi:hypothetical protein
MSEAQRITLALRGRWHGGYGVAFCPGHRNTRTPALSLADGGDGRLLALCHAGCGFPAVLDALRGLGLVSGTGHYAAPDAGELSRLRKAREAEAAKREAQAFACWREAQPIGGTLAERYLRGRGIACPLPETLRFHPACWHPAAKRLPALVAMVEGADRFAVHRTYLAEPGRKAEIEPAKAMLGTVAGGAVRLADAAGQLVVAEGIETALSLASGLLRAPATVWAALSASGMAGLRLPEPSGRLTVATDGDEAGRVAGHALAERAAGLGWAVSLLPAPDGRDWNDVLAMKGAVA